MHFFFKINHKFSHIIDTRETAFVHAITAAGIAFTIAKSCSMGELVECSCDKNLVRHNVLLNSNLPSDDSITSTTYETTRRNNHKNRNKMPRSNNNGNKHPKNPNKRKAPMMPGMGETWEWSGCDDNVNFGNRKSKDFLDSRFRKRSDIRTKVKIHNNNAGRLVSISPFQSTISTIMSLRYFFLTFLYHFPSSLLSFCRL